MIRFHLFDAVNLKEAIPLAAGGIGPEGTPGAIVEVLRGGEAYLVELFGDWVKEDARGDVVPADSRDPEAFRETLGLETVFPHQLRLLRPAAETVGIRPQLLTVLDDLSEELLEEVADFAEFLRNKQQRERVVSS